MADLDGYERLRDALSKKRPMDDDAEGTDFVETTEDGGDVIDTIFTIYDWGYWFSWWIIFIGSWIYAIAAYGYLLGVGLGWLPAGITATVAAYLWPLIALAILGIIGMVFLS